MNSFKMASYSIKRCSLSSRSLVIFLLLVACFEKLEVSSATTSTEALTNTTTEVTTQQPVPSTNAIYSTAAPTTTTKAPYNGICTTNESCSVGFCDNNFCKCNNSQYYDNTSCVNKKNHKEKCDTGFSSCLNNDNSCINGVDDSTYCLCDHTSFWNGSVCHLTTDLQVKNVNATSTANTVNLTWSKVMYDSVYYYINYSLTTGNNQQSKNINDTTIEIKGLKGNQKYNFTITSVLPGDTVYYGNRSAAVSEIVKTSAVQHGSNCNQSDECADGFICAAGKNNVYRCLCNSTQYFADTGQCSNIQVVNLNVADQVRGTKDITFKWTINNPNKADISYAILIGNIQTPANTTGGVVSRLTPGTLYDVVIMTKVPEDSYYMINIKNSTPSQLWTRPAPPGQIRMDKLNTPSHYNISFQPSEGNIANYVVKLTTQGSPENSKDVTTPYAIFDNLKPAVMYLCTVIALNGYGDSINTTASLSTDESLPGSVSNPIINSTTSASALAQWKRPAYPNGNITGYVVVVKNTTLPSCLAAYLVTCSNCNISENVTVSYGCSPPWRNIINKSIENLNDENQVNAINLTDLAPYRNYQVIVFAVNKAGPGTSDVLDFITLSAPAVSVMEIKFNSTKVSDKVDLTITWVPGAFTGPTNFTICLANITTLKSDVFTLVACPVVVGYNISTYYFNDVMAFWNYTINITASTDAGNSPSFIKNDVQTAANTPGKPNFTYTEDAIIASRITLKINCPEEKERNGTIKEFKIEKTYEGKNETQSSERLINCDGSTDIQLTNLMVEKNYSIRVLSANQKFEGDFSEPQYVMVKAKPPLLEVVRKSFSKDDTYNPTETTIGVMVSPESLLNATQGRVTKTGLLVCALVSGVDCSSQARRKRGTPEKNISVYTWSDAVEKSFKIEYRTTPDDWLSSKSVAFQYVIGSNKSCKNNLREFCNGPLIAGTKIRVTAFTCNSAGCELHREVSFETMASPSSDVPAIVGGVVGGILGLALIAAVVGLFIWYKRRPKRASSSSPFWDMDSESRKREHIKEQRPIKIYEFKDHVIRLHKDSNLLFQDEFEDIKKLSARFTHTSEKAKEESNRVKNRYVDILPYDHSRVKLDIQPEDDDSMDFINANFIPGYNSVREYIATQGPMHYTIPDFWRMTWEQKSKVIVMLSDLQEQGKRKVDLYWPENLNEPINYGNIIVEMTNFSQLNKYIIRNFKITRGSDTRRVTHFFLPGWWDFSANLTTEDVLEFAKLVRQEATPANSGPIIVHCSAGVGRTGTFIALDYFMQYIDKHSLMDSVDIFSYVMKMRYNRPRMVQAETQYIFIFDALEEIITKKIKDEEEKMADHTYGNGNIYANVTAKQPEESIYANSEPVKDKNDKNGYDNQAFEMEYQNMDLSQSKKDNPTTVL